MPLVGNAALQVTAPSGAVYTYRLAHPLAFQLAPAHRATRFRRESLDLSALEVITIGSGRTELEATLRFERTSRDLLEVASYAADGRVLTYYPDLGASTSYELWLVNALELVELAQDPERYGFGEYQFVARFRDASAAGVSLEELYAPWLFRFTGGVPGRFSAFTRTGSPSNAWVPGRDGIYTQVGDGLPGIGFVESAGVLIPAYMGNPAATNRVLDSADIDPDDANWNESGAWTQAAAVALFSGKTSQKFTNDGTAFHYVYSLSNFTLPAGVNVASIIVEDGGAATTAFGIHDETVGAFVMRGVYTWATHTITIDDDTVGSGTGARCTVLRARGPNGGKLVRLEVYGTADNVGNQGDLYIYPTGLGSNSLATYLHHAQYETGRVATAPIVTDGSTKTRNAETISIPVSRAPVAMAILADVPEWGTGLNDTGMVAWAITDATGSTPRLMLYNYSPGVYSLFHQTSPTVGVEVTVTPGHVGGDRLRLLALLFSDGAVQIGAKVGSGAVVLSSKSAAPAGGPKQWPANAALYVNGGTFSGTDVRGVSPAVGIVGAPGTDWTVAQMIDLLSA